MADKIVTRNELLAQVATARYAGQTVVHCHGCFDIVHPGHVRYLEFARKQGDLLVVSLTGDSQIAKGDQRPYIPEELRAENLAALEAVDLVYVNPEPTASNLLAELRPDIYVKGREYEQNHHPDFKAEQAIVEQYGGRVVFSSGDVVFSSTRLIESLTPDLAIEAERVRLMCARHGVEQTSCQSLVSAFRRCRVLVVGDVILDRYVLCDATDMASESPMLSLRQLDERLYVGGAGIVARHIAALGAEPFLLSAAACDDASSHARKIFAKESVTAELLPYRSRLPQKTRFLVEEKKMLRVEEGESQPLDSQTEREAAAWVRQIAGEIDAVILCDFGYGTITAGLLKQLGDILGDRRRVITADVSGTRSKLLSFQNVDLLCPTERELRAALHDFDAGLSNVAWNAMDATRARQMLVTLGKKGLVAFDRQSQDPSSPAWRNRLRSEYLPSLADRVADPLGCGDALLACATLALASGGSLIQAAYLGTAAAAIESTQLGNVPIDETALRHWLNGRHELPPPRQRQPAKDALLDAGTPSCQDSNTHCRIPLLTGNKWSHAREPVLRITDLPATRNPGRRVPPARVLEAP